MQTETIIRAVDYITAVYNLSQDRDIEAVDLVLMLARVRALMSFIGTDDGMNLPVC